MRLLILSLLFILNSANTYASTFVGNGGNTGDVELQVTINQVKKSLQTIKNGNYKPGDLCVCLENMQKHPVCESLKSLNENQINFCEKTLQSNAQEMLKLLIGNQTIQFQWTSLPMQVEEKFGLREAEGVARPSERTIFLNKSQFMKLKDFERIFLLTHELGHMIQFENQANKYLRDDEIIGPFTQADGGRQLLNSMGAAVTMETIFNGGINEYEGSLRRSKSYKNHWVNFSIGSDKDHNDKSTFNIPGYSQTQISYRYQSDHVLGVGLQTSSIRGSEKFMTTVDAEHSLRFTSASIYYRYFPNDNPLSYWGQSHLLLGAGFGFGNGTLLLKEGILTDVSDEVSFSSPILSAQYYFPLSSEFWITLGTQATFFNYDYAVIGFKSESLQLNTNLGVSYAF